MSGPTPINCCRPPLNPRKLPLLSGPWALGPKGNLTSKEVGGRPLPTPLLPNANSPQHDSMPVRNMLSNEIQYKEISGASLLIFSYRSSRISLLQHVSNRHRIMLGGVGFGVSFPSKARSQCLLSPRIHPKFPSPGFASSDSSGMSSAV